MNYLFFHDFQKDSPFHPSFVITKIWCCYAGFDCLAINQWLSSDSLSRNQSNLTLSIIVYPSIILYLGRWERNYSLKSFCFTPSSKQLELSKPSLLRVTHARHHQIDYYLLTSKSTNFSRSKKLNSLTNGFAEIIQSRESFLVKSFLSCFEGLSSSSSNNEQHFSFRSKQWNNVMR